MLNISAVNMAQPKPVRVNPPRMVTAVNHNIKPLITRVNKPRVMMLRGGKGKY